jgi:purine-binding chemotaxis protein CheW
VSDDRADHYILFMVAGTTYALPSQDVAHVEMVEEVTKVPNAAPFVDGVVFCRGQVVPAINMRARFGFERLPTDIRSRLLVVKSQGRSVGLLVDSCREFQTIPAAAINPPGDALSDVAARYLSGIATLNQRLTVILNLEALLKTTDAVGVGLAAHTEN